LIGIEPADGFAHTVATERRDLVCRCPTTVSVGRRASRIGLGTTIVEALAKRLDAEVDFAMNPHGTTVSITHAPFASDYPRWR
jgi:two-component sensor histidine kinase